MLSHLHDHPQRHFTFGLLEIRIFENPAVFPGHILIPTLVAKTTEVIRAVVRVETTGPANVAVFAAPDDTSATNPARRRTLSEDEFLQSLPDQITRTLYDRLFKVCTDLGLEKTWGSSSVSMRMLDPKGSDHLLTLFVLTNAGEVYAGWLVNQLARAHLPKAIAERYVAALCRTFPNLSPHSSRPGSLSRKLTSTEVAARFDQLTSIIRTTVEEIRAAAASP
jgi:hypothetical protein